MPSQECDEEIRRTYWVEQMEAASRFMEAIAAQPVSECGEAMLPIPEAAKSARVKVAFSRRKAPGGGNRLFYIRQGVIDHVIAAAREMNGRGWVLKVEDAYRTIEIQTLLARQADVFGGILKRVCWELKGRKPSPEHMLRRISTLVATCPKVGTHMSGSALDITVLENDGREELDRGAPYLEMSELTPMASPFAPPEARRNRDEITAIMARHGFAAYPYEFWHYSSGDAYSEYLSGSRAPARYGAVNLEPKSGRTTEIPDPLRPLHSREEIRREIERVIARLDKTT